jgi:hypothetical protein
MQLSQLIVYQELQVGVFEVLSQTGVKTQALQEKF